MVGGEALVLGALAVVAPSSPASAAWCCCGRRCGRRSRWAGRARARRRCPLPRAIFCTPSIGFLCCCVSRLSRFQSAFGQPVVDGVAGADDRRVQADDAERLALEVVLAEEGRRALVARAGAGHAVVQQARRRDELERRARRIGALERLVEQRRALGLAQARCKPSRRCDRRPTATGCTTDRTPSRRRGRSARRAPHRPRSPPGHRRRARGVARADFTAPASAFSSADCTLALRLVTRLSPACGAVSFSVLVTAPRWSTATWVMPGCPRR